MRLIDTRTLELMDFRDSNLPKYAILSHTWDKDEIPFEQFQSPHEELTRLQGFQKIQNACQIARQVNVQFAWCDTCCIDKRSSSELSEAINSMFKWYRNSEISLFIWPMLQTSLEFRKILGWLMMTSLTLTPKRRDSFSRQSLLEVDGILAAGRCRS